MATVKSMSRRKSKPQGSIILGAFEPDSSGKPVQFRNVLTGHFIMQDAETGKWMVKSDGKPFKGVDIRPDYPPGVPNPAVDKETAKRGENAVLAYLNGTK